MQTKPTDSRQQTADSRQQTADSRQQTADSRQQTADSRQFRKPDEQTHRLIAKAGVAARSTHLEPPLRCLSKVREGVFPQDFAVENTHRPIGG
jgi:hypothetical protein